LTIVYIYVITVEDETVNEKNRSHYVIGSNQNLKTKTVKLDKTMLIIIILYKYKKPKGFKKVHLGFSKLSF